MSACANITAYVYCDAINVESPILSPAYNLTSVFNEHFTGTKAGIVLFTADFDFFRPTGANSWTDIRQILQGGRDRS